MCICSNQFILYSLYFFSPKLRLYLVLLQSLYLIYNLSKGILLCFLTYFISVCVILLASLSLVV